MALASNPSAEAAHKVFGLDPSLSSTGYAYRYSGELITGRVTSDKLRGAHRLAYLRNQIEKILELAKPTLVVYEDYAMGARGNNMFNIGELGGVLKTLVWEKGIDLMLVPPSVMKSVIALSGRAEKADISNALKNRFDMDVSQHDEADAAGLMVVGEIRRGVRTLQGKAGKSDRFQSLFNLPLLKGKLQSISFSRS